VSGERESNAASGMAEAQALRMRRFLFGAACYALAALLVALGCALGLWRPEVAAAYAALAAGINAAFYGALRSGLNLKARDPSLTAPQIAAALAALMFVVHHAGAARGIVLLWVPLILAFGMFRLGTAALLRLSAFAVLAYGAAVGLAWREAGSDLRSMDVFQGLLLAFTLAGFAALGGQVSRLRARLRSDEARFRDIGAASGDWFWETDAEGRVAWMSDSVERLTGVPARWFLGKGRKDLAGRAGYQASELQRIMPLVERRERYRDFRYRLRHSGGEMWVSNSGVPRFDRAGAFLGYRGASRDVTREVEREQAITQSAERLRRALEGSRLALWEADLRSDELFLSAAWAEILGAPAGETRTTFAELATLLAPEDLEAVKRAQHNAVRSPSGEYAITHRIRARDGEWRWIRSTG
jgi:PAS domain S-box-containing protein